MDRVGWQRQPGRFASVAHTSPAVSNLCVTSTPEVAQYWRSRLWRVMVEKDVVPISPQAWLAAN
jgi:hypothetical protein